MATLSNDQILEAVGNMSVLEIVDLVKAMEEKFEVSAAAAMAPVAMPAAGGAEAPAEEKTEFTVFLKNAGEKRMDVLKAVRAITALGIKECKELVDSAPCAIKEGVAKEEAESLKKQLEEAGAEIELK